MTAIHVPKRTANPSLALAMLEDVRKNSQSSTLHIIKLLFKLGHFVSEMFPEKDARTLESVIQHVNNDEHSELFQAAVASYQEFTTNKIDGHFGDRTKSALSQRFCPCPDKLAAGGNKWPIKNPTVWISDGINYNDNFPSSLKYSDVLFHQKESIKEWNAVCGLSATVLPVDTDAAPNIYKLWYRIDGGSGTLAWQTLPYNGLRPTGQLEGRYDNAENWETRSKQGQITLRDVIRHEDGHAFGLPHSSDPNSTMYFAWGRNRNKLNATDIRDIQALYGPPTTDPDPDPTDPPEPDNGRITITVNPKASTETEYRVD
jgi:hypothetical protein